MLKIGQEEADAVARVIQSGKIFRYDKDGECGKFERRYGEFLNVSHVALCSSGTAGLTAALGGLGIGPGDEVIVPAHTYMATALAVLAVGAIPVIIDIDASITMDPQALEEAIGPRTSAVIPVHMWGALCDMDPILAIAENHGIFVVEDACQCVGGSYNGRAAGSMGHAGGFSFNYFKNITCGEGGAVVTNDERVMRRARCMVDPCSFYWEGKDDDFRPFSANGARASEFEGAILNAQLDRLPGLIEKLRGHKARILMATESLGLTPSQRHSPDGECATCVMYLLPDAADAEKFAAATEGTILARTGRHNFTEWAPILSMQGAHHPALNPFNLPQNADCRKDYSKDMCPQSLDILQRTVSIGLRHDMTEAEIDALISRINAAV
jgi:dTDP-4-amino-4,6-dideoxygalactose transaminase